MIAVSRHEDAIIEQLKDLKNDEIRCINLGKVDFRLCCMETHERFFPKKDIVNKMYTTMLEGGFCDFYRMLGEPTFVRMKSKIAYD